MRTYDGTNDKYLVHLIIVFAHIVSCSHAIAVRAAISDLNFLLGATEILRASNLDITAEPRNSATAGHALRARLRYTLTLLIKRRV